MQLIYDALKEAELLVLASPIYYHNMSGQLKCAIDRFYSAAYPDRPEHSSKAAIILASVDRDIYDERSCIPSTGISWAIWSWKTKCMFTVYAARTGWRTNWRKLPALAGA